MAVLINELLEEVTARALEVAKQADEVREVAAEEAGLQGLLCGRVRVCGDIQV